jgi:hypothetical protein
LYKGSQRGVNEIWQVFLVCHIDLKKGDVICVDKWNFLN